MTLTKTTDPNPPEVPRENITIRKCDGVDEFRACVALQKEVWKFEDTELVPLRMFIVAEKVGGQIIGAFEGERLVGYVFSIPGMRAGHPYLHSHMLAVLEGHRDRGVGRLLKLAQRDDAILRGYELIEWTFDPLEIKNAWLNMVKLGAIARHYYVNHYGYTSSVLHEGLPTDRLVAEWWLKSERVINLLDRGSHNPFQTVKKITVPAEIYQWRNSAADLPKAEAIQKQNRGHFLQSFSEGFAVLGYERDSAGNGTFLLGSWDENWSYSS